jgi:enamine deaminase RidA (YjgF/YER057c/UK114 family)
MICQQAGTERCLPRRFSIWVAAIAAACSTASIAQKAEGGGYPKRIASPGGEVVIPTPDRQRHYDEVHFAPGRRAGDYVYISGVIAGRRADEGRDAEAFRLQVRRAFRRLGDVLSAFNVTFADVAMLNSYHDWASPDFSGGRDEQFALFRQVKDEFMPAPHPAWTAVGTPGLLGQGGIVEIQMIAYAPVKPRRR